MPLRDPILIGLTGAAGAGKDTVADRLCSAHGFERHAFAEPIRDMLTALLVSAGIDYGHLFARDLKELPVPHLGVSSRQMMQRLGTEWGRALHPDLWVRHAAVTLGLHDLPHSSPVHDRIVLTDVRFPNEAAWIEQLGGRVIRVLRDVPAVNAHESEQHVDRIVPWARIDNTAGFDWLHHQVDEMVGRLITPD